MKEILKFIWECYSDLVTVVFTTSIILTFIFGGSWEFNVKINWKSAIDLWNTIKNNF
jgi:hypothetical protein